MVDGTNCRATGRIKEMRTSLHAALKKAEAPGEWDHVLQQIGMFSYTGLTPKQVLYHSHLGQGPERQ
jgi:aspartate aminotransferase